MVYHCSMIHQQYMINRAINKTETGGQLPIYSELILLLFSRLFYHTVNDHPLHIHMYVFTNCLEPNRFIEAYLSIFLHSINSGLFNSLPGMTTAIILIPLSIHTHTAVYHGQSARNANSL